MTELGLVMEPHRVESSVGRPLDQIALIEVDQRVLLPRRELRVDLGYEVGDVGKVVTAEPAVRLRVAESVDGLEERDAAAGTKHTVELGEGALLAASVEVDEDGPR